MKHVLVTGGASGIGRSIALAAAARGADVSVLGLDLDRENGEKLCAEIAEAGRRAYWVEADVTDDEQVVAAFTSAVENLGTLDGMVAAAGLLYSAHVREIEAAPLAAMVRVNVTGLILSCREAVRWMSPDGGGTGGSIVNISSMAATIGGRPRGASYAATKAAVDSFTTGLAREVAELGIRVNAVRPGLVSTGLTQQVIADPKRQRAIEESIPAGRLGRPEEIAEAVMWLMSEQADWVSGAHINVSGGGFKISGSF